MTRMTIGIFLSSTVYYVGSFESSFNQGWTTNWVRFNTQANKQSLVYSSNMTQTTCYSLSMAAAEASITMTTENIYS